MARSTSRLGALAALLAAWLVAVAPPASASFVVAVIPSWPATTAVGQTFPAQLTIGNLSTPPDAGTPMSIRSIDLYPACPGSPLTPGCPAGAEAGVYALSATGVGSGPASCSGTWTIVPDTGNPATATSYRFVPPGGEGTLTLTAAGCTVSFTGTTLRVPTVDVNSGVPGVQTAQLADLQGYVAETLVASQASATFSTVTPGPMIQVQKVATPASLPEPGGDFVYSVTVTNTGDVPLTLVSLTDDVYGNLTTQGTCTNANGAATEPVKPFETTLYADLMSVSGDGSLIQATVGSFGGVGRRWRNRAGLAA